MIEGDVASRTAHVVRDDVECPSLSPDGTRLAFKHRIGGGLQAVGWRIHVLDLAKGTEIEVAETRSVDDQVEWLDDETVLYALPSDTGGRALRHVGGARGRQRRTDAHGAGRIVAVDRAGRGVIGFRRGFYGVDCELVRRLPARMADCNS